MKHSQNEIELVEVTSGSHLFGTSTPTSDFDFKILVLPPFAKILLGEKNSNRIRKPEGVGPNDKMPDGAAEYEIIPIDVFLNHFYEGQTYALELAFAVLGNHCKMLGSELSIKKWMRELVDNFCTRNISKMVSYAVSQAQMYGLKTDRFNTLSKVVETINEWILKQSKPARALRIGQSEDLLAELAKFDIFSFVQIPKEVGSSETVPGISINSKMFPLSSSWSIVLASAESAISKYGHRVKDSNGLAVDWRALSHSIRIVEQIIELCETKHLVFPLKNAEFIKNVKQGLIPLDTATAYLTAKFSEVDAVVKNSSLPERSPELDEKFRQFRLNLISRYYNL